MPLPDTSMQAVHALRWSCELRPMAIVRSYPGSQSSHIDLVLKSIRHAVHEAGPDPSYYPAKRLAY